MEVVKKIMGAKTNRQMGCEKKDQNFKSCSWIEGTI